MKWMLKTIIALFITSVLAGFSLPTLAVGSATLSLSPVLNDISTGDTFTIDIEAQANGEAIDTVRAHISFSADLLQLTDASLGSLFPRTSPGSSIDNAAGEASIGGFTLDEPVNGSGAFVTLTFTALKEGEAKITLLSSSKMISNGEEKMNADSLGSVTVNIATVQEEVSVNTGTVSISCSSHPNPLVWYKEKNVSCAWEVDGEAEAYLIAFDQDPSGEPTQRTTMAIYEQSEVGDGVWYLHVKGLQNGATTQTSHYAVRVDATAPNPIFPTVSLEQAYVGEPIELRFGTTDDGSGIAYYEVAINGGVYVPQASPFVLEDLDEGTYLFQVGAVDFAGNAVYGSATARVYPQDAELDRPVGAEPLPVWKTNLWVFVGASAAVLGIIMAGLVIAIRKHKNHSPI